MLVDEAYFHFVEDSGYGTVIPWIGRFPNLIVARTFSKVYGMAGMRLGYAISSEQNIHAMRACKLWSSTNVAVMNAAIASLADPAHVPDQRNKNIETRRWLYSELDRDHRRIHSFSREFRDDQCWAGRFAGRQSFPEAQHSGRPEISTDEQLAARFDGHAGRDAVVCAALREIVPASGAKATA